MLFHPPLLQVPGGVTCLMESSSDGLIEIIEILLAHGADINASDQVCAPDFSFFDFPMKEFSFFFERGEKQP